MLHHKRKGMLQLPSSVTVLYCSTLDQQVQGCEIMENMIRRSSYESEGGGGSSVVVKHYVWGFDCEWKVSFMAGKTNKVALIQFGSHDICILFQISSSGLHNSLIDIIKNPLHVKVGVNIMGDIQKLERDFPKIFPVGSILGACDLRRLSEVSQVPAQRSLAGMVDSELNLMLAKPSDTRCGDWEACPLTREQVTYAALDVYAAVLLYDRIINRWHSKESNKKKDVYSMLSKNVIDNNNNNNGGGTSGVLQVLSAENLAKRKLCEGIVFDNPYAENNLEAISSKSSFFSESISSYINTCSCQNCCYRDNSFCSSKLNVQLVTSDHHQVLFKIPSDKYNCINNIESRRRVDVNNLLPAHIRHLLHSLPDLIPPVDNSLATKQKETNTSKQIVYNMWHYDGHSVDHISSARNIKASTVMSYLIDVIGAGGAFYFSKFQIPQITYFEIVIICLMYEEEKLQRLAACSTGDVTETTSTDCHDEEVRRRNGGNCSSYYPRYKDFLEIYKRTFQSLPVNNKSCVQTTGEIQGGVTASGDTTYPTYWMVRVVCIYLSRSLGENNWMTYLQKKIEMFSLSNQNKSRSEVVESEDYFDVAEDNFSVTGVKDDDMSCSIVDFL